MSSPRLTLILVVLGACSGPVCAQPRVVGRSSVRAFFGAAAIDRVDVVMIGDSNQTFQQTGWDHGMTKAMSDRYGMYATGLLSAGENTGQGAGVGYLEYEFGTAWTNLFLYSGAPVLGGEPPQWDPAYALMQPNGYAFVPAGQVVGAEINEGLVILAASPIDVMGRLRFHMTYGTFPGAMSDPGSFRPALRLQVPPYTTLAVAPKQATQTGQIGVAALHLNLPQAALTVPKDLNFRWVPGGVPEQQPIEGPFLAYYSRAENLDHAKGASSHTLYGYGGQSARDMAFALQTATDEYLSLFFSQVRQLQHSPHRVLVRINTGLNDRNETLPSVGPFPNANANGPGAFADNVQAIIDRVRDVWQTNGWPQTELYFVITVSHPISQPDDGQLVQYRAAADALTLANPHTASVHLERLVSEPEMTANGWYHATWDHLHLMQPGYETIAARELDALTSCPADFDESGALNINDFVGFQTAFALNLAMADFNDDGVLNINDFVAFQTAFALGCP